MEKPKTILSLIEPSRLCDSLQRLLESRFLLQFADSEAVLDAVSNENRQVPSLLIADLSGLKKFGGQLVSHLSQNEKSTQIVCICPSWPESEEIFFLDKILSVRLVLVEPLLPDLALDAIVKIEATGTAIEKKRAKRAKLSEVSCCESIPEIEKAVQDRINSAVAILREEALGEWNAFATEVCQYEANENEEQRKLLLRTVHKLKGSLGCLGLKTASECARDFELCLKSFHTNNPFERCLWWQYMHRLVEEGKSCIKEVEEPDCNSLTFNDDAEKLALVVGKQDHCLSISQKLASKSYTVEHVYIAEELAGYVHDDAPACVFVVSSLAPIPNFEICRYLRSAQAFKDTAIFCIDGSWEAGALRDWQELGIYVVPTEDVCFRILASIVTEESQRSEAPRYIQ